MKVVINTVYGGFRLNQQMLKLLVNHGVKTQFVGFECVGLGGKRVYKDKGSGELLAPWFDNHRNDPDLVAAVEEFNSCYNDCIHSLKVVTIPNGVDYVISDYDGVETIHEKHRMWS